MTILTELDLDFNFDGAIEAIKFDDNATHSRTTLKRVDFIAEYDDCYRFIEVKDPDDPNAVNPQRFVEKLRSGQLIPSLAGKYRDSLFFRSMQNKTDKKIEYFVLLAMQSLEPALLISQQENLRRAIPVEHSSWEDPSAAVCVILNMAQWKRHFGEHSVTRISESET